MSSTTIDVGVVDVFTHLDRCELLKMDIEGGEWAVLEDDRFANTSVGAIVMEFHARDGVASPGRLARELLVNAGFEVLSQTLDPGGSTGIIWAARADPRF